MNRAQWNRISELFDRAIDLPEPERESFVLVESGDDLVVREKLRAMLAADRLFSGEAAPQGFFEPLNFPDEALEDFLPSPPPFQPGELVRDRFRIVRAVGEGGMGHVYEAWDQELDIRVALKTIRPELSTHPESLARFRREVRVALLAAHPNICRTYQIDRETRPANFAKGTDAGETQTIHFFTMEFLGGETLAVRLARAASPNSSESPNSPPPTPSPRPLPLEEALAIARQIAAALDCAHDLGVVHRDIKPANVMLVPAPPSSRSGSATEPPPIRAVVTDFGLAHLDPLLANPGATTLTRSGFSPGTLAYMAPEQLDGHGEVQLGRDPISPATDIYAFGLVLYEMATGQRAYRPGVARQPARALVPDLPLQWDQAIERCLEPDPRKRFSRASEAVQALTAPPIEPLSLAMPSAPSAMSPAPWTPHSAPSALDNAPHSLRPAPYLLSPLLRRPLSIILAIAAVSLLVLGSRLYREKANPAVDPGALVYLAPVKNQTDEKTMDNLTELIQAGLTQSAHINLLDRGRAMDILQQMTKPPDTAIDGAIAREIAMRAGAVRVVLPTVSKSGATYKLEIEIQQPDSDSPKRYRHHWTSSWTWQSPETRHPQTEIPPDLLTQIRDATDWTRRKVGESQNDIARLNTPPEDVTTSSWEALAEYDNAERLNGLSRSNDAVLALKSAVAVDPGFALAYARLGDILLSLNRSVEGFEAYSRALSSSNEHRLTRRERDRIRGIVAFDTRDFATAEVQFRDMITYYETDYLGWFYRGSALMMLDRIPEAIDNLRRAAELRPDGASGPATLAAVLLIAGDIPSARQQVVQLRRSHHPDEANWIEASADFLDHKYDEAAAAFERLENSPDSYYRSTHFVLLAHLAAERGAYQLAVETLTKGIAKDAGEGNIAGQGHKRMDRAYLECKLKRFDDCLADEQEAVREDEGPTMARAASALLGSALTAAPKNVASRISRILRDNARNPAQDKLGPIYEIASDHARGELLLSEGRAKEALIEFRKAATLESPIESGEPLARCLLSLARKEADAAKAEELMQEAAKAHARILFRAGFVWNQLTLYPPGFYADEMAEWLSLTRVNVGTAPEVQRVSAEYSSLRNSDLSWKNGMISSASSYPMH